MLIYLVEDDVKTGQPRRKVSAKIMQSFRKKKYRL